MAPKPRSRGKRVAWLRRYLTVLRQQLARGFLEAWYCGQHWTASGQERQCRQSIRAAEEELEGLAN